jgi:alpha-beta hydrolase superfamily lysophospholipase
MYHTVKTARLFGSQAFHYQALRTMGHQSASGAAPGECLEAIRSIRDEDTESWHRAWHDVAQRCENLSVAEGDDAGRGRALLRASNYYRTAEFFLSPSDARRIYTYRRSAGAFQRAIQTLKIPHRAWKIPYERVSMGAYYFPGDSDRPLIIVCGGYDSTLEESFFWIGQAARERGFPCIMFEGPGQSSMIREYGVRFTPEWEKPLKVLLDFALWEAPELNGRMKVLLGISMGAMLALRAAACENRIDAVAAYGGFFSMHEAALAQIPLAGRLLWKLGLKNLFNRFARIMAARDTGRRWALDNGCWTMGASTPFELLESTRTYTVEPVSERITCHVLAAHGEADHLIPRSEQARFRKRLTSARSFTEHVFQKADGAGEHCQAGAVERFHQVFFGWIEGLRETSTMP